jgi:hypothetical protein
LELRDLVFPAYRWRVRVYSLYLFVVFDYLLTYLFIEGFGDEANRVVRAFMVYLDSVPMGLMVFTLSFYGPVYLMLCYLSNMDWSMPREAEFFDSLSRRIRPLYDILLGLGVAARHFDGGMSWVYPLESGLWIPVGFVLYLTLVHFGTMWYELGR